MKIFIEYLPYFFMSVWAIFSILYILKARRKPSNINKYIFESIPQIFATIGILGTFMGIAYGLHSFDKSKIADSIPPLIDGLRTAFYASIIGIICLIISAKFIAVTQKKYEKIILSDETVALNKMIVLLTEMKMDINNNAIEFNNNFILTDENNNQAKPANVFRDIYEESRKQSQALLSFSTSLADTINVGFEKLIGQQNTLNAIPYLEKLTQEIEAFGNKQNDSTTEMTQNVGKDISMALGQMIDEFKTSMSGSAKAEFENLATLLNSAGGTLTEFPAKLQLMTDNLNENFKSLQGVVQQIAQQTLTQTEVTTGSMKKQVEDMSDVFKNIAKQTLTQSEESTFAMKKQVEEMTESLKNKVGDLQIGQEILLAKQTENLKDSAKFLNVFNNSIEKMNGLSNGINETIKKFDTVQTGLNTAASQLKLVSDNANITSDSFKKSQLNFSEHTNQFLVANKITIDEIQNSLVKAKDVCTDYAQKFSIIEKGLQSIFEQIQTGLNSYNKTIDSSLQSYLGGYSKALTSTVESLAGQSAKHEEILEELTDQLSKLNFRRN